MPNAFKIIDSHNDLANLSADDHLQYVHISTQRTISSQPIFNPIISGNSPFLLGPNAFGSLVSGLNAQYLSGNPLSAFLTITPLNNVSGYLDNRITIVSGLIGSTNNVALSGYFQSEINTLSSGLEFTGNGSGLYNLNAANLTFGSIPSGISKASNLAYLTYVNAVSGWAGSLISGPSNSAVSGYLDTRITAISGLIGGATNSVLSGYLDNKLDQVSGFLSNITFTFIGDGSGLHGLNASNLTYGSIPSNIIISSNLANVTYVNSVSGWAGSLVSGPSNSAISGYLDSRDQAISGYLISQLSSYDTVINATNTSGYLDTRITTVSGFATKPSVNIIGVSYNIVNNDSTIIYNGPNGSIISLPNASGIMGKIFIIKNSGTGSGLLRTTNSQTMFNASPVISILLNIGDAYSVQSDNSNWHVI